MVLIFVIMRVQNIKLNLGNLKTGEIVSNFTISDDLANPLNLYRRFSKLVNTIYRLGTSDGSFVLIEFITPNYVSEFELNFDDCQEPLQKCPF